MLLQSLLQLGLRIAEASAEWVREGVQRPRQLVPGNRSSRQDDRAARAVLVRFGGDGRPRRAGVDCYTATVSPTATCKYVSKPRRSSCSSRPWTILRRWQQRIRRRRSTVSATATGKSVRTPKRSSCSSRPWTLMRRWTTACGRGQETWETGRWACRWRRRVLD